MLTLQKAFSQLRLVAKTAATQSITPKTVASVESTAASVCVAGFSTSNSLRKDKDAIGQRKTFETVSPYRKPGPRRYGYSPKYFTGGKKYLNTILVVPTPAMQALTFKSHCEMQVVNSMITCSFPFFSY
jgi:hypothetical protein